MTGRAGTGFDGATAIVTGGASGIGFALGAELVARGAAVVLADRDGDAAVARATELGRAGHCRVRGVELDVRDAAGFRAVVDETIERLGQVDLLFNNAGVSGGGPTHELSSEHWDRIIDVDLGGVVNGVLAAYPTMVERGHGHIVNTASGAGLVAPPFVTPYAAAKHAVVGLEMGLRPEAALHGVRVSVLCPGAVETPILDRSPDPDLPPIRSPAVTARRYLALVGQRPVPASGVARRALDGVARNRAMIIAPRRAGALWYVHRVSPRLALRVVGLVARRVHRDLELPRGEGVSDLP